MSSDRYNALTDWRPPFDPLRNCLTCEHLGYMDYRAKAAWCGRPDHAFFNSGWRTGCASWQRLVGSDDEPHPALTDDAYVARMARMRR